MAGTQVVPLRGCDMGEVDSIRSWNQPREVALRHCQDIGAFLRGRLHSRPRSAYSTISLRWTINVPVPGCVPLRSLILWVWVCLVDWSLGHTTCPRAEPYVFAFTALMAPSRTLAIAVHTPLVINHHHDAQGGPQ